MQTINCKKCHNDIDGLQIDKCPHCNTSNRKLLTEYIHGLGMLMSDVKIDQRGQLFILVEDNSPRAEAFYREIAIPEEYQTIHNVQLMKEMTEEPADEECNHEYEGGRCELCGEPWEPLDFSGATPGDR